jgi:hypothetical protein
MGGADILRRGASLRQSIGCTPVTTWQMAAMPGSLCASGFCAKMTTKIAITDAMEQKANTKPVKSQVCGRGRCELQWAAQGGQAHDNENTGCDLIQSLTFRKHLPDEDTLESSPKSATSTVLIMNSATRAIKPGRAITPIFPDGGSQPPSTPTDPADGTDEPPITSIAAGVELVAVELVAVELVDKVTFAVFEFTSGTDVPQPQGSRLKSA